MGGSATSQFKATLKLIKNITKEWAFKKRQVQDQELKWVEKEIHFYSNDGGEGFIDGKSREAFIYLEAKTKIILESKEAAWKLKSSSTWLESGDENTKFFQAYTKGCKMDNTIWTLMDRDGRDLSSFKDMDALGKNHFQDLFKAPEGVTIAKIIWVVQSFPNFI